MNERVAVIGASSLIGSQLLSDMSRAGIDVVALTRRAELQGIREGIVWCAPGDQGVATSWICLAPIWALPPFFQVIKAAGGKRVVAFSSTSAESKCDARGKEDRDVARNLIEGERLLIDWAERADIEWVVLRPTLIYGQGRDRNVSDIARWLRRWRVFPLVNHGRGLRQPISLADVSWVCIALLKQERLPHVVFNLVGGETLSYRQMVIRIAVARGTHFVFLPLPCLLVRLAVQLLRTLPRYRHLSPDLVDRMSADLIFDGAPIQDFLGWRPQPFLP